MLPQMEVEDEEQKGEWAVRHNEALSLGGGFADIIVRGLDAWSNYADMHSYKYQSLINADYVIGPAWAAWGLSLRTLLVGNIGNLDAGTLDAFILNTLQTNGFDEDGERV